MDLGALGFWIFIAAVVVAGIWEKSRREAEKHETLRRLVEKTGTVDEAKLKELFGSAESLESSAGEGYRIARVMGTIVMFIGAAIATFFVIIAAFGKLFGPVHFLDDDFGLVGALAVSAGIAMLGFGIFFSARFCEPPAR